MADYKKSVATDVCGDKPPCAGFISPVEAALSCTPIGDFTQGGFPRAGGRVQIEFFSGVCTPSINPSINFCFPSPIQVGMCAAQPQQNKEYNPTKFITSYGYFASALSEQGTAAEFRMWAEITNSNQSSLDVVVHIDFLDVNSVWNSWLTVAHNLKLQGPYSKLDGLAFKSDPEYIPVSPSGNGPNCEVKFVRLIAGVQSLKFGCGIKDDLACSMWDGNSFHFCFRGEIFDKTNTLFPKPFLTAFNRGNCGNVGFAYCGCDNCELKSTTSFECLYNTDPAFIEYLYTPFNEPINVRQDIQIADGTYPLEIMIKSIGGTIYFYYRNVSTSQPWQRTQGTLIQTYGPSIWKVEDSDWLIYFYNTKYPSPEIVPDCNSPIPYTLKEGEISMSQLNLNNVDEQPDGSKVIEQKKRYEIPCIHLGPKLDGDCGCGGGGPLFKCEVFGQCRRFGRKNDAKVCSTCDKYEPKPIT